MAAADTPLPPPPFTTELQAARTPLVVPAASDNPLRKQTLLGIAPVLPDPAKETAPALGDSQPHTAAAAATTDAPTTRELESSAAPSPVISWPPPQPTSSDDDEVDLKPKRKRWLVPLGIAAALGLGAVGLKQLAPTPASAPPAPAAKAPPAAPTPAPPSEARPADVKRQNDDDLGPSTGDDGAPDTRTPDPQPLGAAPSAEAAPAASPTPSGDVVRVQVDSDPPGARLFWKGKAVGTTPFVLELARGEKHAYEMGLPGYNTRKVVIDGSKAQISVGLKPDAGPFIGQTRRKP